MLLLEASRNNVGSNFCTSELRLKNVSKKYRNDSRFGNLEAWVPDRQISIEYPSKVYLLHSDQDPYMYARCSDSEGPSLRSGSLKHQIWDGMVEDIPHARPLKGSADFGYSMGIQHKLSEICMKKHSTISAGLR